MHGQNHIKFDTVLLISQATLIRQKTPARNYFLLFLKKPPLTKNGFLPSVSFHDRNNDFTTKKGGGGKKYVTS